MNDDVGIRAHGLLVQLFEPIRFNEIVDIEKGVELPLCLCEGCIARHSGAGVVLMDNNGAVVACAIAVEEGGRMVVGSVVHAEVLVIFERLVADAS